MSRALDQRVKQALKQGDHRQNYDQISSVLLQRHPSLLEIELLGHSHELDPTRSYLQDGNAIAIPKLNIVRAFIIAREKLGTFSGTTKNVPGDAALTATAVILLTDAEHLTAANTRKRILMRKLAVDQNAAKKELLKEKYFLDSLLTSRLHRHTKSPNLWSHRRWLLDQFKKFNVPLDIADDLRSVVFISGERHPRNYYAWCHARYLITAFKPSNEMLGVTIKDTKKWCYTHHTDVSGWMFLLFLLEKAKGYIDSIFVEVTKLVESFHWRNESVWYFLKNLAFSDPDGVEMQRNLRHLLETMRQGAGEDELRIMEKTATWIRRCSSADTTS